MKNASLLVFANKQDLPNAMSLTEVTEKLELSKFGSRSWFTQVPIPIAFFVAALHTLCPSDALPSRRRAAAPPLEKACTKVWSGCRRTSKKCRAKWQQSAKAADHLFSSVSFF